MSAQSDPDDLNDELGRARLRELCGDRQLTPELKRDLLLAIGCGLGRASAIAAFDSLLREEVARIAATNGLAADELAQLVRERLLMEGQTPPLRVGYARAEWPGVMR